jgi:hypothetical protein
MAPLRLLNMFAVPIPAETGKPTRLALIPTPGRAQRVDLGAEIQGIYCEPGVRNGALFVVAGGDLYSISAAWVATNLGTIGGSGQAAFAGLRDNLYVARAAKPWRYNGSALTQVSDVDAPDATSLLVLSQRLVASEDGADTYYWSNVLDGTSWEALGFATAEQRPDEIRRMLRLSGQIIAGGASSIEIIRATTSTTLPFQNITGQSIDETQGFLSAHSWAIRGDKLFLIGGNLMPYLMSGFSLNPLPRNGEMEDDLLALPASDRLLVTCMAYQYGSNEFFKVRIPNKAAYVFNTTTGFWHREQSWEEDTYPPKYHATAYGYEVQADEGGTALYTLDNTVFTDAGTTVERMATLRASFADYEIIGSLCVDLQAFGRPASGQGSNPTIMVDVSTDGRNTRDDTRSELTVTLGADGRYQKPVVWGLGMVPPGEATNITIRMTDPVGITINGAWINEGQRS